jgi:hypothetical protein
LTIYGAPPSNFNLTNGPQTTGNEGEGPQDIVSVDLQVSLKSLLLLFYCLFNLHLSKNLSSTVNYSNENSKNNVALNISIIEAHTPY